EAVAYIPCFFIVGLLCSCGFLSCVYSYSKELEPETPDRRRTLKAILNGIHNIGRHGMCHYECIDGKVPPSDLHVKRLFDIGIPSLTKFCNQHNYDCEDEFQECLERDFCRRLHNMLGLLSIQSECDNTATLLFNAVMYMRCKPYIDSQRDSCSSHLADI
uniref:Group XIIA secretory phospholipase A2 n=1 Tax=Oncorhynchus kisutch TaxID=8019 RepID=A0A8C7I1Y4_ONCKI